MTDTYQNRIKSYLEPEKQPDTGKGTPELPVNDNKPQEPTCEHCVFQKDGICHRYPQRVQVRINDVYLIACGEFDDGLCDECSCS